MIQTGATIEIERSISADLVRHFAEIIGDHNPIHLDADYAATTVFKKPIAHGMLAGGLFSSAIANHLPGPGSIYLSQTMKFSAPVYVGSKVKVQLTVTDVNERKGIFTIETLCKDEDGKILASGEAVVMNREVSRA